MMNQITIAEGITLTATRSTIDAYEAECKAIKAEREAAHMAAEAEHELWLMLQSMDRDDPLYSDLYKDLYGFRPR